MLGGLGLKRFSGSGVFGLRGLGFSGIVFRDSGVLAQGLGSRRHYLRTILFIYRFVKTVSCLLYLR